MTPRLSHQPANRPAKLVVLLASWCHARFSSVVLPHRISYTARSVPRREIVPGTQVRKAWYHFVHQFLAFYKNILLTTNFNGGEVS
jgi:hypothetical protein